VSPVNKEISDTRRAAGHHLLFLAAIIAIVFLFGAPFLNTRLGIRDFGGAAAWLAKVASWCDGSSEFSLWVPDFFCGQPLVMILPTLLWYLMYVPFALVFGVVLGLKIGMLFYLALAGFTCFAFVRWYVKAWWPAWLAGIAYALHPIHLDLSGQWGLTNFAVFYPYVPLLAMLLVMLARRPSLRLAGLVALVATLSFWADFQRPFVTFPFLGVFFLYELIKAGVLAPRPARTIARGVLFALGAGALAGLLLSFAVLPVLAEQEDCTLIPPAEIAKENRASSLHNPLYPFDANRMLTGSLRRALPAQMQSNAGVYYMGLVSMALSVAALVTAKKASHRAPILLFLLLATAAYWVACGVYSPWETWARFLDEIVNDPLNASQVPAFLVIVAAAAIAVPVALVVLVRRRREQLSEWLLIAVPLGAGLLLFGRPFVWLTEYVPFYGKMRSPTWFVAVVPAFASAVLVGLASRAIAARVRDRNRRQLFYAVAAVLLLLDVFPYRSRLDIDRLYAREFGDSRVEPGAELEEVAKFLDESGREGRWITADPYSPLGDALNVYTDRPAAWSWLHWSSAKGYGRYFEDREEGVFTHFMDPARVDRACAMLGVANVRYIIASPIYMRNSAVFGLPKVFAAGEWVVMENPRWRPFVQVYPGGKEALAHPSISSTEQLEAAEVWAVSRSPDEIAFTVKADEAALVVVAESWYPHWSAAVDGRPADLPAAEGAFLAVNVDPGRHEVKLTRTPAPVYRAGGLLTAAGLILLVASFIPWRKPIR